MVDTKARKQLVGWLECHGYECTDTTGRGTVLVYTQDGFPEVRVRSGLAEHSVKRMLRGLQKLHGEATDRQIVKRNTGAIKERQAAERARLAQERDRNLRRIDEILAELAAADTARADRAERLGMTLEELDAWDAGLWREAERLENENRELERLMQEGPQNNRHEGRVGSRAVHRA